MDLLLPLRHNSKSSEIKNLHYILFFLKQQLNNEAVNKLFADKGFLSSYSNEVFEQQFGKVTAKLVFMFQEVLHIKQRTDNVIDELTANKFNELLRQFGGLGIDKPEGYPFKVKDDAVDKKKYTISGSVMPANGKSNGKITVAAFNKNLRIEKELGRKETATAGSFTIEYEPAFPKSEYKTADVFFRLFDGKKEIKDFTVIEVVNSNRTFLDDGILFNAGETIEVELSVIDQPVDNALSEFEEIDSLIQPLLEDTPIEELNENKEHKDFGFLSRETGLDKSKISRFALSHRLLNQSGIDAEFWYALTSGNFYQELSASFPDEDLDSNQPAITTALYTLTGTGITEIIKPALDSNIIATTFSSRLPKWAKQFSAFILQRISNPGKNDPPTYIKSLVSSTGLTKEKQEKFLSIYLDHGNFGEAFWKQLAADKGLAENETRKLQFAHSLTTLAGNNEKLVNLATALPRINSMRELALKHTTNSLAELLTPDMLPGDVEGKTPKAKINNYAAALQQQLFAKETSAVLQRMATDNELPIKNEQVNKAVAGFFNNQPDFNIRITSVYHAIRSKDAFRGIAEKHQDEVVNSLKTLQRVQAISPAHDTVTTLMKANINSAHQVTEMSENSFMTAFSKKMGEDVAKQVYANATNLKLRNEHALISMKEAVQGTGVALIDGRGTMEDRKVAFDTKAVEKNIPVNWESLFGNVDFCECGECTSVYSPAAYFVELLQYLRNNDLDPNSTGVQAIKADPKDISGTVLEKLFRRRPDLGCLELTCANTNTILPYVDLVNEVMESFIVHLNAYTKSTLNPKQATIDPWNVEDETSAELLAQPQHINNDAYLELKKTVYPFTLPYDRPVDMIRIFLQYLDTSRYELMKTFRTVEQDSISKNVMPEDTTLPATPSPDPDEAKIPAFNKTVSDRAIDAEFLSLTQEEYIILTKEAYLTKGYFNLRTPGITDGQYRGQIGVKAVPEYYGYTGNNSKADMLSTNETDQLGLTFVKKQFLKRTGLLYSELVELLKTQSLNPVYPSGKPLVVLESIPFSYRFLQGLVDKNSSDPATRFKKLIDALVNPQNYIPGYDEGNDFNPCKPGRRTRPAFRSVDIKQWVFCYFERIGQMIVLENNVPDCDCVEGKFAMPDGTDIIQVGDMEGQLSLTKSCDLVLSLRNIKANVGHVDSMTGFIVLTDRRGNPLPVSVLTDQRVSFKGASGESAVINSGRLINRRTEKPFGCKEPLNDNCDLTRVRLKHLDGRDLTVTEYDKIHRFIRLWRKMGWSINETDKSLVGLTADKTTFTRGFKDACDPEVDPKGFAEITPDFLHQLTAVKKLLDKTGLELIKLLAFWADINTTGEKSLYQRLFLAHNLLAIDNVFKADANGNYLAKPEKVIDHIPVLMAAFHVKYEDIDALVSPADPLNLSIVSKLYRSCVLAKLLHIKTADLKEAFVLFGSDPFQNADAALTFFDKWDRMDSAGLSFAQLDYVIQDNDDPLKPVKPSKNNIISLSKTIYDGLNAIDDAHPDLPLTNELVINLLKATPTAAAKKEVLRKIATEELVRSKISLLYDPASVESVMGLLQGSFVYSITVPAKMVISTDQFSKAFPDSTPALQQASAQLLKKLNYDFNAGILQVTGLLTAKELTTLQGLFTNPGWKPAFKNINDQAQYIFDDLLAAVFKNDLPNAIKILLDGDVKDPDNSDNDSAPVKREYFLEIFLPFLRDKLKEKFLAATLAGAAGLGSDVTTVLITDILKGASTKSLMTIFKDANQPPTGIGWKGYLVPGADDDYLFAVKDIKKSFSLTVDGKKILDEKFTLTKDLFISGQQKLTAGQPYFLEIAGLAADLGDINWSTAVSPKTTLPREMLLPIGTVQSVEEGFIKLFKTAIVVNGFALTAEELSWLQIHGVDFDNLDFNAITLPHLLRLEAYTRLRNALPASDITLIDFFKWVNTAAASVLPAEQIALLIQRKKEDIGAIIAKQHFNLVKPGDFSNEINLLKLLDAFAVYDKINMKIDLLFDWAQPVSRFAICQAIAETIRKSIQARYKQDDWEQVIKPLNDQLREHQKQALINYLLVKPDMIAWGVVDADSLFEFFLIDVQMDACMQTSRIKQAISSVQLFVQRCFLGEEAARGVPNNVLNRDRWQWMKRNPLWVANRKVFCYPENWIEGRLRDDKSSIFKELESELLQKDIQQQNVRDALQSYLYKVDEVSNMEVVGLYIEMTIDSKGVETNIPFKVHVFGRTRSTSPVFYYRCFNVTEGSWYAWEKIQVDIPGYQVSHTPISLTILDAKFTGAPHNTVNFKGYIGTYPAALKNFSSRFAIGDNISLNNFGGDKDPDGHDLLKNISFDIEQLGGSVNGNIRQIVQGLNSSGRYFVGVFDGLLTRKVNTNGCYLIPVVWNGRLLIFFPQIKKNTKTVTDGGGNKQGSFSKPVDYYEIKMAWSEYRNGKWTQKQVSKDPLNSAPEGSIVALEYFKFVPYVLKDYVLIAVDDRLDDDGIAVAAFLFDGNSIRLSPVGAIDKMPFNYFHKIENFIPNETSKIFSWQLTKAMRANTSIYFENSASKEMVRGLAPAANFFHPYSHDLLGRINLDELETFFAYNLAIADKADAFGGNSSSGYDELKRPYSLYNWELFFHVPFQIATELSANQHFEEAMKWYHYIFDPTAPGTDSKRCWKFRPFKEIDPDNFLENLFMSLQPNSPDKKITQWRDNPFQPHAIARTRPSAYMKNVVMKYIDNLLAWGDYLFTQDTLETVNYATQLYVLAAHMTPVLQMLPKQGKMKPETYNSLLNKWDAFGNAMVELELVAPFSQQINQSFATVGSSTEVATANIFGFASSLYFCIPNNPKLMAYRDLIADRLYKIRHCENIEGVFRMLPLWDPPIDPALLVAAMAQGQGLDGIINDLNTPLPNYRFIYLLQKAIELCNEVKVLGNSLLSVFEKENGESLAAMRAGHETAMHNLVMEVKKMQVDEANSAIEGLQQNRRTTEYRLKHYLQMMGEDLAKIPEAGAAFSELADPVMMTFIESGLKMIADEKEEMDKASLAHDMQILASLPEALSGILHAIPDELAFDFIGFIKEGGTHLGPAASAASKVLQIASSVFSFESANAQRKAGFRRQLQDRILQANLAGYECMQIDKQIASQQIRINIANQEITNQQKMIDHSAEVEAFIKDKYTNEELYKWMKGQLKTVYRQVYDLAWDWAKKAERVFCFERGVTSTGLLQGGYWDGAHDGLLSGEKLFLGLKHLEAAYHENRGHDFEVTKHISLQQLDPLALIELREVGKCEFSIPEVLFDMDFPGHYMRRIKSVALSIPCIAGPYTSVNATLRLQEHSYRRSSIATNNDYPRKTGEDDDRFSSAHIPIASIATSSGQHDSGVFELNFKDERYMPFEGAGVFGTWSLELSPFRQLNYETISDIILHFSYTSKDGGDKLQGPARAALMKYIKNVEELSQREGLFVLFDLKNDFPNEWHKAMLVPPGPGGRLMELGNLADRLPFFARNAGPVTARDMYFVLEPSLKIADLSVLYQNGVLPGSMEGPQKIDANTVLYRMSDVNKQMEKVSNTWTLKFANSIKEPGKIWMVIRYTLG